jgi:hypothetical protein
MKLSELIVKLQGALERDGDLDVYGHDMNSVTMELCSGGDFEDADSPTFGKTYQCIG